MSSKRSVDRSRSQVFAVCPVTGIRVATHALMTSVKFKSYARALAVFCPLCDKAHLFERAELQLTPMGHLSHVSPSVSREVYSCSEIEEFKVLT